MIQGKHFCIFKFETVGLAYQVLNEFCILGHELYEISPIAEGCQLIVCSNEFDSFKENANEIIKRHQLSEDFFVTIKSLNLRVLNAYHSLELAIPEKEMTIVESSFIGDLFFIAHNLENDVEIIDLRSLKFSDNNYLILKNLDDEFKNELVDQGYSVTSISNLNEKVIELFKY